MKVKYEVLHTISLLGAPFAVGDPWSNSWMGKILLFLLLCVSFANSTC